MADMNCHINTELFSEFTDYCNGNQYEITYVKKNLVLTRDILLILTI